MEVPDGQKEAVQEQFLPGEIIDGEKGVQVEGAAEEHQGAAAHCPHQGDAQKAAPGQIKVPGRQKVGGKEQHPGKKPQSKQRAPLKVPAEGAEVGPQHRPLDVLGLAHGEIVKGGGGRPQGHQRQGGEKPQKAETGHIRQLAEELPKFVFRVEKLYHPITPECWW